MSAKKKQTFINKLAEITTSTSKESLTTSALWLGFNRKFSVDLTAVWVESISSCPDPLLLVKMAEMAQVFVTTSNNTAAHEKDDYAFVKLVTSTLLQAIATKANALDSPSIGLEGIFNSLRTATGADPRGIDAALAALTGLQPSAKSSSTSSKNNKSKSPAPRKRSASSLPPSPRPPPSASELPSSNTAAILTALNVLSSHAPKRSILRSAVDKLPSIMTAVDDVGITGEFPPEVLDLDVDDAIDSLVQYETEIKTMNALREELIVEIKNFAPAKATNELASAKYWEYCAKQAAIKMEDAIELEGATPKRAKIGQ